MNKCPECGSTSILWDYKNGIIVCSNCGLVIDNVYDYTVYYNQDQNNHGTRKIRLISEYQYIKMKSRRYRDIHNRLKILEPLISRKLKRYLTIDEKALKEYLNGLRPHVKIFKYHKEIQASIEAKILIEKVINKDPVLTSRTDRAKIALALIILDILSNGKPDIYKIARKTSISVTHVRRLLKLLEERKHIISFAKTVLIKQV